MERTAGRRKPYIYLLNVSGGNRSATFTVNTLSSLIVHWGNPHEENILFSGASGGMLGATYFRELYRRKLQGQNDQLTGSETEIQYFERFAESGFSALCYKRFNYTCY